MSGPTARPTRCETASGGSHRGNRSCRRPARPASSIGRGGDDLAAPLHGAPPPTPRRGAVVEERRAPVASTLPEPGQVRIRDQVNRVARYHRQRGGNVRLFYERALSSPGPQEEDRRRITRERVDALHVVGARGTTADDRSEQSVNTGTEPASRGEVLLTETPGRTRQTGPGKPALEVLGVAEQIGPVPSHGFRASEEVKAQASRGELDPRAMVSCPQSCPPRGRHGQNRRISSSAGIHQGSSIISSDH